MKIEFEEKKIRDMLSIEIEVCSLTHCNLSNESPV